MLIYDIFYIIMKTLNQHLVPIVLLNLLYSNHLPSSGIQRHVDATEIALPNELTPNPFEDGCKDEI